MLEQEGTWIMSDKPEMSEKKGTPRISLGGLFMRPFIIATILTCAATTLSQDPKDATDYYERGMAWHVKSEYDKAISDYRAAIRLDPKYAAAYSSRGAAWNAKREHCKAIADYNEAIRLDPEYTVAYYSRGNAMLRRGEYDKAIADYSEAIRLDPECVVAYYNRGLAWQHKGEYDKAIADYSETIRLDPDDAVAYNNRGAAWDGKGKYDKAVSDYSAAIRLDPKNTAAHCNLAWLLATCPAEARRDGKKAIEHATKGTELTKWKDSRYIGTLAAAYAEAGDYDEAVRWQKAAMSMCPENLKDVYRSRLNLYNSGEPYRVERQGN